MDEYTEYIARYYASHADIPKGHYDGEIVKELTRCKDCRLGREVCGNIECCCDMNVPPEYHGYDWFCPNGERKEE